MGGFRLTGPTMVFTSVPDDGVGCLCKGLRVNIAAEQESEFLKTREMTVKEFHTILNNKYRGKHIYEGLEDEDDEGKQVVKYTATTKN